MSGNTVKITITTTDGKSVEKSFTVLDGEQGPKGDTGPQGPKGDSGVDIPYGDVGTLVWAHLSDNSVEFTAGETVNVTPELSLLPSSCGRGVFHADDKKFITSGTWRCLGYVSSSGESLGTLWQRVA